MMHIFRSVKPKDETVKLMQEAVLYHARQHVFPVWKRRARYSRLHKELAERLESLGKSPQELLKARRVHSLQYEKFLSERMGAAVMHYPISFMPVNLKLPVRLFSSTDRNLRGEILSNISPMVQNLNIIWESGDPQEFVFLVGRDLVTELEGRTARDEIGRKWVEATTAFHMERGSDS